MWPHLDKFQTFAVLLEVVQAVFIGIYYQQIGEPQGLFVSEILFTEMAYKICMTFFVFVQLVMCGLYLYRFWPSVATVVGYIGIAAGIGGWLSLNDRYMNESGKTTFTHHAGTIVFLLGAVFYVSAIMTTMWDLISHSCWSGNLGRNMLVYLVIALWAGTIAMGITFMDGAFANGLEKSWIYEHTTFLLFTLTHVFLFMLISPDPRKPAHGYTPLPGAEVAV